MKLHNKLLSAISLMYFMTSLYAADFQLQNVRVGGLGCPSELTSITLAPDASAASIIFQQFESRVPAIATGPKVSRNISTLNCNIFLDIKIPAGVKLEAVEIAYDMRGFATFDRGVIGSFKSYLMSKSGLGTQQGSRAGGELITDKSWTSSGGSQEEDFTISSVKSIAAASQCARGSASDIVSIRLQNTLSSQILAGFEYQSVGSITMDSSDIKGGLKLSALTSSCGRAPGSETPNQGPGRKTCRLEQVNGRMAQVCI